MFILGSLHQINVKIFPLLLKMAPVPFHTGTYRGKKFYFVRLKFVTPINKCKVFAYGVDKTHKYCDKQKG